MNNLDLLRNVAKKVVEELLDASCRSSYTEHEIGGQGLIRLYLDNDNTSVKTEIDIIDGSAIAEPYLRVCTDLTYNNRYLSNDVYSNRFFAEQNVFKLDDVAGLATFFKRIVSAIGRAYKLDNNIEAIFDYYHRYFNIVFGGMVDTFRSSIDVLEIVPSSSHPNDLLIIDGIRRVIDKRNRRTSTSCVLLNIYDRHSLYIYNGLDVEYIGGFDNDSYEDVCWFEKTMNPNKSNAIVSKLTQSIRLDLLHELYRRISAIEDLNDSLQVMGTSIMLGGNIVVEVDIDVDHPSLIYNLYYRSSNIVDVAGQRYGTSLVYRSGSLDDITRNVEIMYRNLYPGLYADGAFDDPYIVTHYRYGKGIYFDRLTYDDEGNVRIINSLLACPVSIYQYDKSDLEFKLPFTQYIENVHRSN